MSTLAVNSVTDANGGNTATINSMTPTADSLQGFRNRILNGGMVIDQRNAGASATNTGATTYYLDRWVSLGTTSAGQFSVQQDSNAPAGFSNSAKITVTTIDSSLAASDRYTWMQRLEGYTVSDFDFGKASAKTITLSFYVRSSVTGTFGAGIQNSAADRSYPFNYTISSADTWEYKTVTIPGDTTGTWPTNNSRSLIVLWALGVGSDREGTANTWAAGNFYSTSGSSNLMATLNATWYITGVQLEVGSVATPFERRPYGTELSLCQRYYYKEPNPAWRLALLDGNSSFPSASAFHPVEMRATPTTVFESLGEFYYNNGSSGVGFTPSGGTTAYVGNARLGFSRKNSISNGPGASQDQKAGQWNVQLSFSAEL